MGVLGVSYRFGQRAYKGVHPQDQEEVSSMAKSKRMTATVKMTFTEDTDLIAWWNSIPRGSRNAVMKDLMREYIKRHRGGFRPVLPRIPRSRLIRGVLRRCATMRRGYGQRWVICRVTWSR
jgi:hypothetical protein